MNMRDILRRVFSLLVIFVYMFVLLFQNIPFLNIFSSVSAEDIANKDNVVLVLVDGNIYNNIKWDISYYAWYIQRQNRNTKALVLPINTKLFTAFDIQKLISNLYFWWEKNKVSFLKWIVLIWDIPLPVINNWWYVFSSIYPYVDIQKPAFIRWKWWYFVPSWKKSDVELIHWVIKFSSISGYHAYFSKLKLYEQNPPAFVSKKFYYDNFITQKSSYNKWIEKNYINKIIFAANLVSKKITPLILEIFDNQTKESVDKLDDMADELKEDNDNVKFKTFKAVDNELWWIVSSLWFTSSRMNATLATEAVYKDKLSEYVDKIKDFSKKIKWITNPYWMLPTLSLESTLKSFVKNYSQLFWSNYTSEMTDNLEATGRYSWENTISTLNTIDIKDSMSVSYIYKVNKFLEKKLDEKIEQEKYYKEYPISTYYWIGDLGMLWCGYEKREVFFYGRNAKDVKSLQDIHIYRWTYWNFSWADTLKNISSRWNKSVTAIMNNLFDMQTQSNRWYNTLWNAKKDWDHYKNWCSKIYKTCKDLWRYNWESSQSWAKRIYGWYSPLNIKISEEYDPNNISFNYENYKYAWSPSYAPSKIGVLFDAGGTIINKVKEPTIYTDTIAWIKKYASVLRTEHEEYDDIWACQIVHDHWLHKVEWTYKEWSHIKMIDTRVKHVSPTKKQFDNFNISTPQRPVDSVDYITFLWVWWDTVRLDYPDLFSVEVYDGWNLKIPTDIDRSIRKYLKNLIKDYNSKLSWQASKWWVSYWLLPENYFIDKIWPKKIAEIAELLYYLNLWWQTKSWNFWNLKDEIDSLYNSFDINEKISYNISNYIDTEDEYLVNDIDISKSPLNFPWKASNWYEAWMIVSKNMDNIWTENNHDNTYFSYSDLMWEEMPLDIEAWQQKECWRTLWEWVILWEWPSAFMCRLKETLKKPFKIWKYSCAVGNEPDKLIWDAVEAENIALENTYKEQDEKNWTHNLEKYEKLRDYIENEIVVKTNQTTYLAEDMTWSILIRNYQHTPSMNNTIASIYINSENKEGNCLFIKNEDKYENTCNWVSLIPDKWKIDFSFFNPQTWEWRYLAYKAWSKDIAFKFCTVDNICYVKWLSFDKIPWELKDVEMKAFSPVMVYWWENPVAIVWYDAKVGEHRYRNKVTYTPYNYKLELDPPIWLIKTSLESEWSSSIDYNFSNDSDFVVVKSNTEQLQWINKFHLKLTLDSNWNNLLQDKNDYVKSKEVTINIEKKQKLTDKEITYSKNYTLPSKPYNLVKKVDWVATYDPNKLFKIHIQPIVADKTLKTPVKIETTDHFIVWFFKDAQKEVKIWNTKKIVSYKKFVKNNEFLILDNDWIDIYLLPTYKTWKYRITVKIPWIDDYIIDWKFARFPAKKIFIKLDKWIAKKWEKVKWRVYAIDEFKNVQALNWDEYKITTSDDLKVTTGWNEIEVSALKSWFLQVEYDWKVQTQHFQVENTFLPIGWKMSVMYLTLLWYWWWQKAIGIMWRSTKSLAITTNLHTESEIKHYDYIVWQNLKNQWDVKTELILKPNLFKIDFWRFSFWYPWKVISSVKQITKLNDILLEWVYYLPEKTDSFIKKNELVWNKLFINNEKVIDFSNQTKKSIIRLISNNKLSDKYWVYSVYYKNRKVWNLIFNWKILPLWWIVTSKPFSYDIIPGDWSTNWLKAIWFSFGNIWWYKVYSKALEINVEKDPRVWFRSNFRNITDFAAWNNVWQSVRPFENELIINYGDPFIKRTWPEWTVPWVDVSKTYWKRIFSRINWWIKKVTTFDFNNDWLKDILIAYKWWKIRILKNYKWYENFENLWNLIVLGKDIKDIAAWDINADWYDDILVLFSDNTIRVYKNHHWEFDVDGTPVCLPLPLTDWEHLSYEQIFFRDMNNDHKLDIVVNDRASDVKVYFWPTFLSTDKRHCDAQYKTRVKQKLVKSYWLVVWGDQFVDDGYIYRDDMEDTSTLLKSEVEDAFKDKTVLTSLPISWDIIPDNYLEKVSEPWKDKFAFQDIPKNLWPDWLTIAWDTISFKKVIYLDKKKDKVVVTKKMVDLNGGTLLPWDKVKITVTVTNPEGKNITYLESLKWPFAVISKNDIPIVQLHNVSKNLVSFPQWAYRQFIYKVSNCWSATFSVSYTAIFQWESTVHIKVWDWNKDKFWDIKVYLKNGCIKWYDHFKWGSGNPMSFSYTYVDLAKKLRDFNKSRNWPKKIDEINQDIKSWNYEKLLDEYVNKTDDDNIYDFNPDNPSLSLSLDIWPDISNITSRVNWILKGLCKWYSFGKSSCSWSPVPCNFAFFAPWFTNLCGCAWSVDPGTPVFWNPWTVYHHWPHPIPMGLMKSLPNDPLGPKWWVYPSTMRLYVSPTLSMGLWVALCFWRYKKWMNSPTAPVWSIAWNCVVVAKDVNAKCNDENADDILDDWMVELSNWVCNEMPIKVWEYPRTSIISKWWDSFQESNMFLGIWIAWKSIVQFTQSATRINSIVEDEELLEWGTDFGLHIKMWTFKGIISCIIKKWLNHQIQFTISQLTHMTIYVLYPDMSGLMDWFDDKTASRLSSQWSSLWNLFKSFWIWEETSLNWTRDIDANIVSKYLPDKKWLKELSETLNNPFEAVKWFLSQIPLVNVNYKTVVIRVPWIWKDELERQISYMNDWLNYNKDAINSWKDMASVSKNPSEYIKVNKFINSVKKNIKIMEEYRTFPLKLYKYLHSLDLYLDQVMCILKMYIKTIVWWLNVQSKIFESWVDTIIALINIFKTWQLLIDVSVNWKSTCWKCRMDTGDLYDCTLTWLCPSLPVLPIPPFKIPDIFIDFTHIDLWMNIVLPRIKIRPVAVWLFTLPSLPYAGGNVKITLPALPILPAPPELPDLPWIPPVPKIELPNLPPPPRIPNLMPSLQVALKVFKIVWYFRCIIKNGIWLVAEWNVKTRIEQLTARHNRLFPFDFVNIDFPELPFKWFDVKVDWYLRLRAENEKLYEAVKKMADKLNEKTKPMIWEMMEVNLKVNSKSENLQYKLDDKLYDNSINLEPWKDELKDIDNKLRDTENKWQNEMDDIENEMNDKINKGTSNFRKQNAYIINNKSISTELANKLLSKELQTFISAQWESYLTSLSDYYFDTANNILKSVKHKIVVRKNVDWIQNIEKQVSLLIDKQHIQISKVRKIIKDLEAWKKIDLNDDVILSKWNQLIAGKKEEDKSIVFNVSLFNVDNITKQTIENSESPYKSYYKMYSKLNNKMAKKLKKYKISDPKYVDLEKENKIIENILTWWDLQIAYSDDLPPSWPPLIADPSQSMRWLYMYGWHDTYYNVMADKQRASKIKRRNTYFLDDLNNDGSDDLIWYDKYSIYIKYSWDKPLKNWITISKKYIYWNVIDRIYDVVDEQWYIHINGTKFKVADKVRPINNLSTVANTYEYVKLKWNKTDNVNAFVVLYSSRIDVLNEFEKQFNYPSAFSIYWNNYKIYAIIYYDRNLKDIVPDIMKNVPIDRHRVTLKEFNPGSFEDRETFYLTLDKKKLYLQWKWKYFRVYNANITKNSINIISSYSNQDVWWEQLIWDIQLPLVEPTLIRKKTWEVISTWKNMVWFVNTEYILKANWEDNVWLKKKYITDDKFNLLVEWDKLHIEPENKLTDKYYYLVWEDYNWNRVKQRVKITFTVPRIKINSLDKNMWSIVSEIWKDMDLSAVKYMMINWGIKKFIKTETWKEVFLWWVWQTIFNWSVIDGSSNIKLYNKEQKEIWYFDLEKWLISVKEPYYVLWTTDSNILYYNVYNVDWKKMFSIYIPSKEIVKEPELLNSWKYLLKTIDNPNLWKFDKWYCLYDKNNKICAMYISRNGDIYTDNNYKDNFIVWYHSNVIWNIEFTLYDTSVPNLSSLEDTKKIMYFIYKPKNLLKK